MYYVIEVFDSGYEREVRSFETEQEALSYCNEFGYQTGPYSYLTIMQC